MILKDNKLKANIPDDFKTFPEEYPEDYGFKKVSFTRQYNLNFLEKNNIRLVLDRDKLKTKYKIIPHNDPSISYKDEYEEIIKDDIYPLDRYLVQVDILKDPEYTIEQRRQIFDIIQKYKHITFKYVTEWNKV